MANVIAGTASSIAALSQASTLAGSLTNLLLATPNTSQTQGYQPQNPPTSSNLLSNLFSPPGLLFHYEGEQTAALTSDITDHFIEDNTSVQDQISIKPVVITTHGFIGELNNVAPPALALLSQAANTLTTIPSFLPAVSSTATQVYNQAFAAYQLAQSALNAGVSAWSSLSGGGGESVIGSTGINNKVSNQNKQQSYFQQFYGYWYNRTLFTVQTPWAIFQNMAILSFRALQDAETRVITDFEISFKQINAVSTAFLGTIPQVQGRAQSQFAAATGTGTGAVSPSISVAKGLAQMGAAN